MLNLWVFGLLLLVSNILSIHVHPFRTFYHEAALVLAVLCVFLGFARSPSIRINLPQIIVIPLFLITVLLFQAVLKQTEFQYITYPIFYFTLAVLAVIVGATWTSESNGAQKLCLMLSLTLLIASVASVLMQCVQIAGIDLSPMVMYMTHNAETPMRPFANVAQPNQLALLLCFGLASIWWLVQAKRLNGFFALAFSLFLLWGLALTQSRIAWIILPIFALLAWFRVIGELPIRRSVLLLLLIVYVGFVWFLPSIAEALGFSSASIAERVGGRSERSGLLQQAWFMIKQNPWFGVGWFGFGGEQVKIAADFPSTIYAEHSHNLVLNLMAELGVPAALLIFATLLFWFYQTCIARTVAKNNQIAFGLLSLIAVGVHSMVEFPLWYAYVLLPIAVLMGMLHQMRWPNQTWVLALPRAVPAVISVVGMVVLVLVTLDYQRVVHGFKAFRQAATIAAVPQEAITRPAFTLLPDYFDYFQLMKITPKEKMSAQEIAFVERMSLRFGYVHVLNTLAEVYVLNGQVTKAQRTLLTLQRLHPVAYPGYFDYWQNLAQHDARFAAVFLTMPKRDAQ
jgi:O-antigen ligase